MKALINILGLCARARKIATGEMVLSNIRSQKAKIVLIASDASDNTKKKLIDKCTYYKVKYFIPMDSELLSKSIGQNNRMAVAIMDQGFALKIEEIMKG